MKPMAGRGNKARTISKAVVGVAALLMGMIAIFSSASFSQISDTPETPPKLDRTENCSPPLLPR
jgi:hypothetical protein